MIIKEICNDVLSQIYSILRRNTMDNAIIYIKLIQGCAPLKYINESLKSQEEMYYILTKNDISEFKKTVNGEHYLVAIERSEEHTSELQSR